MAFDPNLRIIKLKGKDYLEVKWRLVWFREDHPDWAILTEIHTLTDKVAVVVARVADKDGNVKAMGTKSETPQGFADYLEKAETGSIGRALAALGYGTQFAPELDEGDRIVDSPVDRKPSIAAPVIDPPITADQVKRLFSVAKSKGWSDEQIKASLTESGYQSSKDIKRSRYEGIVSFFEQNAPQEAVNA